MSGARRGMGAVPQSLAEWLACLEGRHPVAEIVLGLERVGTVAARMGLSFFTVRNHAEQVMLKMGVNNRSAVGPLLMERELAAS